MPRDSGRQKVSVYENSSSDRIIKCICFGMNSHPEIKVGTNNVSRIELYQDKYDNSPWIVVYKNSFSVGELISAHIPVLSNQITIYYE